MGWWCFEFKKHAPEMTQLPSRSARLIAVMHHDALTELDDDLKGKLHVKQFTQVNIIRVYMGSFSTHQRFAKLKLPPTHPPHVLVSAKVLLDSRRAKGGFSFGRKVLHG
jgi:hypothetical protein